jgi:hypothetical protein
VITCPGFASQCAIKNIAIFARTESARQFEQPRQRMRVNAALISFSSYLMTNRTPFRFRFHHQNIALTTSRLRRDQSNAIGRTDRRARQREPVGEWTRESLLKMDARFCDAMERAIARGLERRSDSVPGLDGGHVRDAIRP